MAENYGTLEGTLDEHGVLSGEMNDRATLEGEIQFGSGGGGVLDVFQNGQSVVEGRYAFVTVPTFLRELRSDDYHNTVTSLEMQIWNGKADPSDIPTALSQLDNDDNYVQDADYVHTDNNFTDEDKAAIGNIPENITDLSDVAVDNIQNGQVLKWDATQEKFVNANESGGGGDVTDVKVDGTSVVDPITGEADIDLSGKADKVLDAVAGDFAVLLANGNCANSGKSANDMASKAEMSVTTSGDQTTIQLKSGTSATVINQHQDISGKADKSSLGTAAEKDSTALIVVGSTDLAEAGAVRDAIDSAVASSYHHAGTKTCAELVASLLVKANEGNVYNMTDSGVTTADFIEGAGKPIEEGANVGIAKIAENTYKFDLLSGFINTSNFIEKSVTSGFVKNDGSIDTNTYQQTEAGKGLSTNDYDNTAKGIVDGVTSALAGKVDKETGKGLSTNDYTTTEKNKVATIDNKADKVSSATNGNLAGLNSSGNLTDSGWNGAKDTTSISGNPISISGLKSNQLAVNPIITLEPIQAGSGTPSPVNQRPISGYDKIEALSGGKNLFDADILLQASGWSKSNGVYSGPTNTPYGIWSLARGGFPNLKFKPNTQYTLSLIGHVSEQNKWFAFEFEYSDGTTKRQTFGQTTDATIRMISDSGKTVTKLGTIYGDNSTCYMHDIQLEEGSSATTYEPCNKATSISESLGQTVYWGRLDVRIGKFDVLGTAVDLANLEYNVYGTNYVTKTAISNIKIPASTSTTPNGWAERREIKAYASFGSNSLVIGVNGTITIAGDIDAPAGLFVYELADSAKFTIQLTPHEISLLKDYAYVSTNGTNIALDYHNGELASLSDVSQLGETVERQQFHAYSSGAKKIGTWIDGSDVYEEVIVLSGETTIGNTLTNVYQYTGDMKQTDCPIECFGIRRNPKRVFPLHVDMDTSGMFVQTYVSGAVIKEILVRFIR